MMQGDSEKPLGAEKHLLAGAVTGKASNYILFIYMYMYLKHDIIQKQLFTAVSLHPGSW